MSQTKKNINLYCFIIFSKHVAMVPKSCPATFLNKIKNKKYLNFLFDVDVLPSINFEIILSLIAQIKSY